MHGAIARGSSLAGNGCSYHESIWEALPRDLDPPDLTCGARSCWSMPGRRPARRPRWRGSGRTAGSVLDVGCGEGQFAAELAQRRLCGRRRRRGRGAAAPRARRDTPIWTCGSCPAKATGRWRTRASTSCGRGRRSSTSPTRRDGSRRCAACCARAAACSLSTPAHGRLALSRACAVAARLRGPLRSPRRSPALLHSPHAHAAARGLRLRGHPRAWRRRASRRAAPAAASARRSRF